jgi:probable addiction module antidote protein
MNTYKDDLFADLADPEYAALYLTAAYRESRGAFLIALKDVADARLGMTRLAASVKANRVSLYRTLSEEGNPTLSTFNAIVEALDLDVSFTPRTAGRKATVRTGARSGAKSATR